MAPQNPSTMAAAAHFSGQGMALRTAMLGAPVMALLFVLFPRLGPLWGVPQDGVATTGLSNAMRMGSMAEIAGDQWKPEYTTAWQEAFVVVQDVMLQGAATGAG